MIDVNTIAVLLGLVVTVMSISAPIIKLNNTVTLLNASIENLKQSLHDISTKNSDAHRRIWEHNTEQDKLINNHEGRISKIEDKIGVQHGNGSILNSNEQHIE